MIDELNNLDNTNAKHKNWLLWIKPILFFLILSICGFELFKIIPRIAAHGDELIHARPGWVIVALGAAGMAMHSFAKLQQELLRSAGVYIKSRDSESLIYTANAISITLPGGQVFAPTFLYNQTRKIGASTVVASWQLVMSGLLMTLGLTILGIGGVWLASAAQNPLTIIYSLLSSVSIFLLAQLLATYPEILRTTGEKIIFVFNQIRKKPSTTGIEKWNSVLSQLNSVRLSKKSVSKAFLWSTLNWCSDVVCLLAAVLATGFNVSVTTIMIAYASSRAVGTIIPWIPAGLGVVDSIIISGLVSGGMTVEIATIADIIYRVVRFLLVALIGWVIFFLRYRDTKVRGLR